MYPSFFQTPEIIPYVLTAFICAALGIFQFLSGWKRRTLQQFAVLQFLLAALAFSRAFVISVEDSEARLVAEQYYYAAALVIPVVFLSLIYHLIYEDRLKIRRMVIFAFYFLAALAVFLGIFVFFDNPIVDARSLLNRVAPIFYGAVLAAAVIELTYRIFKSDPTIVRERLKITLTAVAFAFAGGSFYFFSFPNDDAKRGVIFLFSILFFSATALYAFRTKRAAELSGLIKKISVWSITSFVLFVFLYFDLAFFRPWIVASGVKQSFIAFTILFFLALAIFYYAFKRLDKFFRKDDYDIDEAIGKFRKELITLRETSELFDRIEQIFYDCLAIENMSVYSVVKEPSLRLELIARSGVKSPQILPLYDLGQLNGFFAGRAFVFADENSLLSDLPDDDQLKNIIIQCQPYVIIPLSIHNEISVIIILGKRKRRKAYTQNTVHALRELIASIETAYSNAKLYEDSQKWTVELERSVKERQRELNNMNLEYAAERDDAVRLNKAALEREMKLSELKNKFLDLKK